MNKIKTDCLVVGAGAAGMMAAGTIAESSKKLNVVLLEKNTYPGKKLLITGKGRCNVTNNCSLDDFLKNIKKRI